MSEIYINQFPKQNEGDNHAYADPTDRYIIMGFWGRCHAIRLINREQNDRHICFEILTNDDEHWSVRNVVASSAWMPELIELMITVNNWLKENAIPDIHYSNQHGYKY